MNKFHQQIREFRRANLARLVEERGGGQAAVKRLAELAHCNYEYLNQILRGTIRHDGSKPRTMADGLASRLEIAAGKPGEWMDRDPAADHGWRAILARLDDKHGPRVAALAAQLEDGSLTEAEFDAAVLLLSRPRAPALPPASQIARLPAPVASHTQD